MCHHVSPIPSQKKKNRSKVRQLDSVRPIQKKKHEKNDNHPQLPLSDSSWVRLAPPALPPGLDPRGLRARPAAVLSHAAAPGASVPRASPGSPWSATPHRPHRLIEVTWDILGSFQTIFWGWNILTNAQHSWRHQANSSIALKVSCTDCFWSKREGW